MACQGLQSPLPTPRCPQLYLPDPEPMSTAIYHSTYSAAFLSVEKYFFLPWGLLLLIDIVGQAPELANLPQEHRVKKGVENMGLWLLMGDRAWGVV